MRLSEVIVNTKAYCSYGTYYHTMKYSINPRDSKSNPRICLDLDEVCSRTRSYFLDRISSKHGVNVPKTRLHNPHMKIPEIGTSFGEAIEDIVSTNPDVYNDLDPIPGAPVSTRNLSHKYEILIASRRFSEDWLSDRTRQAVYESTKRWLDDHGFAYDKVARPVNDKTEFNYGVIIDDDVELVEGLDKNNEAEAIPFVRPHNKTQVYRSNISLPTKNGNSQSSLVDNPRKQWSQIVQNLMKNT